MAARCNSIGPDRHVGCFASSMTSNVRRELERILRRRRAELIAQATGHESALRASAEKRESEIEGAAQGEELDRVLSCLDDRERHAIVEINDALDRLVEGTYGRCVQCHTVIDIDRLVALPEAALCIRCAGALDRVRLGETPSERSR